MKPENFKNHQIFQTLEALKKRFQEKEIKEIFNPEELHYYRFALDYISNRLKATFPVLIDESELNSLNNELNSINTYLNNYLAYRNWNYLNQANNNWRNALRRSENFPIPISKTRFNFSKEIANFEQTISEKYKELEDKNKEISEEIERLSNKINNTKENLSELEELIEQNKNEVKNLASNFESELENIKKLAEQEFEIEKNKFRQEFEQKLNDFSKEFSELREDLSSQSQEIVKELKLKLDEAKKLVNIIGNIGVTGNYQKIAEYHKKQANIWRWIALGFMVLFTGLLIWSIYHITSQEFNWIVALIRIIAFATLIYPAAYAAKESSKHRRLEILNKKYELDLASINPFIENLPESKKQEIKEKLVEKFFGNNVGLEEKESKSESGRVSVSVIEEIIKKTLSQFFQNKKE